MRDRREINVSKYIQTSDGLFSEYFLGRSFLDRKVIGYLSGKKDRISEIVSDIKYLLKRADARLDEKSPLGEVNQVFNLRTISSLGWEYEKKRVDDEKGRRIGSFYLLKRSGEDIVLFLPLQYGAEMDVGRTSPYRTIKKALMSSDIPWGIISNGKKFRLVKNDAIRGPFVEVDIQLAYEEGVDAILALFALIFMAESYAKDSDGESIIDYMEKRSKEEAAKVGEGLRDSVYYAVERLMKAVYEGMDGEETDLKDLFEESLIYMFRLLFLLYAESAELLPLDNEVYRSGYSITNLRELIIQEKIRPEKDKYYIWDTLNATFNIINEGVESSVLHVEPYNGGLFDGSKMEIMEEASVPDSIMIEIIKEISLTPETRGRGRDRVSFRDLSISELGSIYEALLELEPKVAEEEISVIKKGNEEIFIPSSELSGGGERVLRKIGAGEVYLSFWGGTRKSSGTYYTPKQITQFLVQQAIGPQVEGKSPEEILEIKVLDPAMGSGAFLVAATEFLGDAYLSACREKARRIQEEKSGEELEKAIEEMKESGEWFEDMDYDIAVREARRRVLEKCIYGVDLNPLAVDLAKVSLWLTAMDKNKPLTFLDHKLRHGNSLIGTTKEFLKEYNPDITKAEHLKEAAKRDSTIKAKIKEIKEAAKKVNSAGSFFLTVTDKIDKDILLESVKDIMKEISQFREGLIAPEDDIGDIKLKEEKWLRFLSGDAEEGREYQKVREIYDLWTALWFWEDRDVPTPVEYMLITYKIMNGVEFTEREKEIMREVHRLRKKEEYTFFHWELEFPEVFENGGFDAVVGNPPWDIVKPNSDEFFSNYDPKFRSYPKQKKKAVMKELMDSDSEIKEAWEEYTMKISQMSFYVRNPGFYPHQYRGDINLYKLFLERFFWLIREQGRMSIIVPSGIYTDEGTKELRRMFLEQSRIEFLIGFENRGGVFSIHKSFKFALLSAEKGRLDGDYRFKAGFFIGPRPKELKNEILDAGEVLEGSFAPKAEELENLLPLVLEEGLEISRKLIERFSPDSLSIMEFKRQEDIDLAEKIYGDWPLLGDELKDSWNVKFTTEFHMTNDSHLFVTRDELESAGARPLDPKELRWELENDAIVNGRRLNRGIYLPLYEGKMIWQFDAFYDRPQYWVSDRDIDKANKNFKTGLRSVASSTNERSLVCGPVLSKTPCGNSLIVNSLKNTGGEISIQISLLNSYLIDFVLRQKVSANINMFYLYQLPLPRLTLGNWFFDQIVPRAARLICVDEEFAELWEETFRPEWKEIAETSRVGGWENLSEKWSPECGVYGWREINGEKRDDGDRAQLRAEIDALVAHLYGLTKEEFSYILDTFPVLRKKEEKEFGEYRTKRMCLEEYERFISVIPR